ncbi:LolA family protein [Geoalkalibacter sp.]|uniref:LolA family protein n=1 Tax=Geoalkalibacter sp. TaxID=3041440 RepID=UPI00272E66FD|nr:DUF4292 domain-containing protein [Geoalkalibacter sp.]
MLRLLFLLFVAGLAACAPRPAPLVPLDEPTEALTRQLLAGLEQTSQNFHSLEGFARVRIVHPEKRLGANQVLFIEKPDRLRSESLNPFGQPMLSAATDGETFSVYLPGEKSFYRGAATLQNVQRFVPIPLQVEDLVHIILYDPPLISYSRADLRSDPARGYSLLLSSGADIRQELLFDGQLRLREVAYFRGDTLQLQIRYDKFSEARGAVFPLTTEMSMPVLDASATVELRDIDLNTGIPIERFSLTPPSGVPVLPIPQ